jgi:hypothetical protein
MFERFRHPQPDPYEVLVQFWKEQIPARRENGEAIVGDEHIEAYAESNGLSEERQAEAYWQAERELSEAAQE